MLDIIPNKKEMDLKLLYNQNLTVKIDDYFHKKLNSDENSLSVDSISENSLSPVSIDAILDDRQNNVGTIKQFTKHVLSSFASLASANKNVINAIIDTDERGQSSDIVNSYYGDEISSETIPNEIEHELLHSRPNSVSKRSASHLQFDHKYLFDAALKLTNIDNVFNNGPNIDVTSLDALNCLSVSENTSELGSNFSYSKLNSESYSPDVTLSISFFVQYIEMGKYRFQTWYRSFYPQERISHDGGIHLCDRCLIGLRPGSFFQRHYIKCPIVRPPGRVVKRQGIRTIYEIDGKSGAADYCRNLCLLAMFFISGKVAYHEVDHFVFYVLTVTSNNRDNGEDLVGYFSRDKDIELNHTMSCLFILPPHMKQGHGSFLIDYSYRVAKSLGVIGSPEKPLSTTGLIAFRSYWWKVLSDYLKTCRIHSKISIKGRLVFHISTEVEPRIIVVNALILDISFELGIAEVDIITTLQYFGKIKKIDDNYYIIR